MTKVNVATQKHEAGVIALEDYHVEWYVSTRHTKKNKRIVDVCRFIGEHWAGNDDEYEVMYMDGECTAIDSFRTYRWDKMRTSYIGMVKANCPESWHKLVSDLAEAKALAQSCECFDGGTCNFDSPALYIPDGMTYQQVAACCACAGVSCYDWKPSKHSPALVVLCSCAGIGQADRRTKGAESAQHFLQEHGWNCTMYYRMD